MIESLRRDQHERWQRSEPVSVESYVQQYPALADDTASLAELIVGEITLREARGESPRREEYFERYPQCAEDLRRQFAMGRGTLVAPEGPLDAPSDTPLSDEVGTLMALPGPPPAGAAPQVSYETILAEPEGNLATASQAQHAIGPMIPGYEILNELGRGGMGIVYKARQLSANRLVALKVVRNDVLAMLPQATRASTLERFKHEAQAAACLEHDNLVTVFEVGEANGLSYYAMRYVEGQNLHEMISKGPLENFQAARYIEPVARGLHAAHLCGILHRDLKPHNILVDKKSDRPLLTDFGLAKFLEQRDELTHAGDVMGTPSYMSPEQSRDAGKVTALADVYSLGATLYHVLTARPPFQAANPAETIRQIIYDEPVPPRRLNPEIDKDLETICLKCLQKEPARRYASAELLADDLRRYLLGEPIVARPLGPLERMWRWCRRNPAVASLMATAASFAIFSLISIIVGYYNTAAALAKSESRLQKALQVVDELFTRVSEDELLNEPGLQPLRKDLLERALKHYQYFLAESGGNAAIRDEAAAARFRVGLITQLIGSREEALKELTAAREMQKQLLAEKRNDVPRLKALSATVNALGSLHAEMRSLDQAAERFTESEGIRTKLTELEPGNSEFRRLLANTRMNLGIVDMQRGKPDEARKRMQRAQDARLKLLDADPGASQVRRDLARGYYSLAQVSIANANGPEAVQQLRDAIVHFERLLAEDSRSLSNRYYVALCYRLLGGLLAETEDVGAALAMYKSALEHTETLAAGNPEVAQYQAELAVLSMDRGDLYGRQDNLALAQEAWNRARETLEGLLERDAGNPDYRRDLAVTLGAIGNIQLRSGERTEAAATLTLARDRLQALLKEFPDDMSLEQVLADTLADLGEASAARNGDK